MRSLEDENRKLKRLVAEQAVDLMAFSPGAAAVIGTPDDLVAKIKSVIEVSGGFGTVVALDPASGKKLWEKQLGAPIRAAPTAAKARRRSSSGTWTMPRPWVG